MESDRLTNLPLEIQYMIFDKLSRVDISRAGIVIADEIYWSNRHKHEFAASLREIECLTYSINGDTSTTLINGWRTTCIWDHRTKHSGKIKMKLTIKSRNLERKLGSVITSGPKKYVRDLDGGIKLHRVLLKVNRDGFTSICFYEKIVFEYKKVLYSLG